MGTELPPEGAMVVSALLTINTAINAVTDLDPRKKLAEAAALFAAAQAFEAAMDAAGVSGYQR